MVEPPPGLPRVLVIGGTSAFREALTGILTYLDYDVTSSASAEDAHHHLIAGAFAAVLLAADRPEGDALERALTDLPLSVKLGKIGVEASTPRSHPGRYRQFPEPIDPLTLADWLGD